MYCCSTVPLTFGQRITKNNHSIVYSHAPLPKWFHIVENVAFGARRWDFQQCGKNQKGAEKKKKKNLVEKKPALSLVGLPWGGSFCSTSLITSLTAPSENSTDKGWERAHHWILNILNMDKDAFLSVQGKAGVSGKNILSNVSFVFYTYSV